MDAGLRDLMLRWQRALVELCAETGRPQTIRAVGRRMDCDVETDKSFVLACGLARAAGLTVALPVDDPVSAGCLNEYAPVGEQ